MWYMLPCSRIRRAGDLSCAGCASCAGAPVQPETRRPRAALRAILRNWKANDRHEGHRRKDPERGAPEDLDAEALGRERHRAPELQPWPLQAGRGGEGEAPPGRSRCRARSGARRQARQRARGPGPAPRPARRGAPKAAPAPAKPAAADLAAGLKPSGVVLRTLTEEERDLRGKALADARVREAEERSIAEEDVRRRAARDAGDP